MKGAIAMGRTIMHTFAVKIVLFLIALVGVAGCSSFGNW